QVEDDRLVESQGLSGALGRSISCRTSTKAKNALDALRASSHAKGVDSPLLVGCRRWPTKRDFFGKPLPFPSEPAKSVLSPPATANAGLSSRVSSSRVKPRA